MPRPRLTHPSPADCLVALRLLQGVGNVRALTRLCIEGDPYKWLVRGVAQLSHYLNDFRVDHEESLDDLLTSALVVLIEAVSR